jgi:hypothetical protein
VFQIRTWINAPKWKLENINRKLRREKVYSYNIYDCHWAQNLQFREFRSGKNQKNLKYWLQLHLRVHFKSGRRSESSVAEPKPATSQMYREWASKLDPNGSPWKPGLVVWQRWWRVRAFRPKIKKKFFFFASKKLSQRIGSTLLAHSVGLCGTLWDKLIESSRFVRLDTIQVENGWVWLKLETVHRSHFPVPQVS